MRYILQLSAGLTMAVMSTAGMAEWSRSKVTAFGFSADFPAPPSAESTVEGELKVTSYFAVVDGTLCLVAVGDYPNAVDPELMIPANRDSFAKEVGSQVTTQKRMVFPRGAKDLQAIQFDTASSTYLYRSIIVIEGPRYYQIVGGVLKDRGNVADLDRCVKGFSLIAN